MTEDTLLNAVHAWQRGALTRDALITQLTSLGRADAPLITELITQLHGRVAPHAEPGQPGAGASSTDVWRDELMGSRACTWGSAGLLVGPSVLILTDGRHGVVLGERDTRALNSSVSGSLMLLCQTIVMAEHALNERDMRQLQEQRLESASTSLSEIDPIH
ncbi:hypothetical protein GCM10008956_13910 [Deinococcus arenae]|uniref:Uncharacterized protein n=1 Tax=Deinococcus arenae TaxID=1452751 RepID=A0A8H9GLU6_9DEIO|nr:hypothetical protein [Deinococcus arenae]AWT37770.1 hypothetical protein DM785_19010 [Deinococcus actinosclerus]GGM38640.1 hypothetical protein GCM10008956_13910 [Deinococcus arenae]